MYNQRINNLEYAVLFLLDQMEKDLLKRIPHEGPTVTLDDEQFQEVARLEDLKNEIQADMKAQKEDVKEEADLRHRIQRLEILQGLADGEEAIREGRTVAWEEAKTKLLTFKLT